MLSYNIRTLIDNLVRELRSFDVIRQKPLIREILAELGEELGEYIIRYFEEEARDLRKDD